MMKHPNIVSLLGYSVSSEAIVLIMNYVPGKNLDVLIFGKDRIIAMVCQ